MRVSPPTASPAPPVPRRITVERIEAAASAIDAVFLRTPQWMCAPLADELGVRVALKAETLNPIRSFKGRGAGWLVRNLPPGSELMCAAAGNFGQAMAYACRAHGVPLTVYAAKAANPLNVARMRAVGATVVLAGADFDAAKALAELEAARRGRIGGDHARDGSLPGANGGDGDLRRQSHARADAGVAGGAGVREKAGGS